MGVSGWNSILKEYGWLPYDNGCCSTSLWMDMLSIADTGTSSSSSPTKKKKNNPHFTSNRIVAIPRGSNLHIDGYCLCFYINNVAYARHIDRILYNKQNHQTRPCTRIKLNSLKSDQIRHLLPTFVPLSLLTEVTKEYINSLRKHNMNITIYWDGKKRYSYKQETDDKRKEHIDDEWSDLYQYSLYGKLPSSCKTICELHNNNKFPKHRLFVTQILHTLRVLKVNMVDCDEEADHVLARQVNNKENSYVIGNDSDFCFYPNINYIPIYTMNAKISSQIVTACVIRRDELIHTFNLPDENSLIELLILLGCDYIPYPNKAQYQLCPPLINNNNKKGSVQYYQQIDTILEFLREQGTGYRVTSISEHIEEVLLFIRMLYNLEDLSNFPFEDLSTDQSSDISIHNANNGYKNNKTDQTQSTTIIHPRFDIDVFDDDEKLVLQVQPMIDKSLKDTVLRCLEIYRSNSINTFNHQTVLTDEHIDAFRQLQIDQQQRQISYKDIDKTIIDNNNNKNWRPEWDDIITVYYIEKIINLCIREGLNNPIVLLNPPSSFFDQYKYHALLQQIRIQNNNNKQNNKNNVLIQNNNNKLIPSSIISTTKSPLDDNCNNKSIEKVIVERPKLPVDEFEDDILASVRRNRVTIIQGETGCGKSSRIPIMLLRADSVNASTAKLFISQPRRIAAKSLVERLRNVEPDLKNQIALRMGHGVREYETPSTRAWFVTTGYLVRLLANNPHRFDDISYLIIDEVHERSVDTDILCLLCRRLLKTNPHIRLILMSATMATSLYQEYFNVSEPPIKVGARRFPVEEIFLDDLRGNVKLLAKEMKNIETLVHDCNNMRCLQTPSMRYMEKLYSVVSQLATVVGAPGSSVLIFVPGMNDIVALCEMIDQLYVAGLTFKCLPIHSDIPFDDQMQVFGKAKSDEIKIIIATNAAESSVTLPDCDNVICLGLCKQIIYNETSHRQMLTPTWISKASATQRAGRTGRVRPGKVWRMYTREVFENSMAMFEPGEMIRIPLDSVILMLKEMLVQEEAVTDVLLDCLEPPNIKTIDRSFESLFRSHFITSPDDSGNITTLGSFVTALGIDLALGSLIGLGIQFGVGAEAIQMAAILSFPQTPWIMSNPLIHDAISYNVTVAKSFSSRCHFDANLFSDALSMMNLIWEYRKISLSEKTAWCIFYSVFQPRLKRLLSTCDNLRRRVADFLSIDDDLLLVNKPPSNMSHSMITILRIIQVWVFHDTIIEFDPTTVQQNGRPKDQVTLTLGGKSDYVEDIHFKSILSKDRHPFTVVGYSEVRQKGSFDIIQMSNQNGLQPIFSRDFEERMLSYCTEKNFKVAWILFDDSGSFYIADDVKKDPNFRDCWLNLESGVVETILISANSKKRRNGRSERACGLWKVLADTDDNCSSDFGWTKSCFNFDKTKNTKRVRGIESMIVRFLREKSMNCISVHFPWKTELDERMSRNFTVVVRGNAKGVSDVDMKDLFGSPKLNFNSTVTNCQQKIHFPIEDLKPLWFKGRKSINSFDTSTSWGRPPLRCIPEGARILSILASGRRREHVIRLPSLNEDEEDDVEELQVYLDKTTKISQRWKRFNTNSVVYVQENSIAASAVPMCSSEKLYCCCANTLEVRGGGLKAEGLTLLPPGKLFLLLCRFTFGLFKEENVEDNSIAEKSIKWIDPDCPDYQKELMKKRIELAVSFSNSAQELEERLECFPEKVVELLSIFEGVDGHDMTVWENLAANPFVPKNLTQLKNISNGSVDPLFDSSISRRSRSSRSDACDDMNHVEENEDKQVHLDTAGNPQNGLKSDDVETILDKSSDIPFVRKTEFTKNEIEMLDALFTLPIDEDIEENDTFPSVILSYILHLAQLTVPKIATTTQWKFFSVSQSGQTWFKAIFCPDIPYIKRKSKNSPSWLKQDDPSKTRPSATSAAFMCIPPCLKDNVKVKLFQSGKGQQSLAFSTLEMAIQMEVAFWLERQFLTGKRHWYQHDHKAMATQLKKECNVPSKQKKKQEKTKKSKKK